MIHRETHEDTYWVACVNQMTGPCYGACPDQYDDTEYHDEESLLAALTEEGWQRSGADWLCPRCHKQATCDPHDWVTGEQKLWEEHLDNESGARKTVRRWPIDFPAWDSIWCRECKTLKRSGTIHGGYPTEAPTTNWSDLLD